jgi:hypothetical protein
MFLLQIFAATAFLAGTAQSQVADSSPVQQTNSLRAGAWALQFQVGRDFTLGSFDGTTLSIQKHTSAGGAWRLGVTLAGDIHRQTYSNTSVQDTTQHKTDNKSDNNSQALSLGLTRVVYPRSPSTICFFYGIGPRLSYGRDHFEADARALNTDTRTWTNWSVGAGIVLGVEYFPSRAIGLSGEYSSSAAYRWEKRVSTSIVKITGARSDTVETTKGFRLATGGARLGLSVYW